MNWYYAVNQQQYGPVGFEDLLRLVKEGRLLPTDLVWNPDMGEQWVEARTVSGLILQGPPATIPPANRAASFATPHPPEAETPAWGWVENAELTRRARASLSGYWGLGVGVTLLNIVITQLISYVLPLMGLLVSMLVSAPLTLGITILYLTLVRGGIPEVGQMFSGFAYFGKALGVYFFTTLFTLLWMLLFIIPGIIASISYAMAYYILADNPHLNPLEAIRLSKEMMRGYKFQYFCLGFRFLGWTLLAAFFTLGIGLLWVIPYMQTSYTHFYEMLRSTRPE
jgi:uncharacterized membrane protein